jgi:hypothetical protein
MFTGKFQMPDPSKLKVGDLVKFMELPDEWTGSDKIPSESREFMGIMFKHKSPSRVYEIDEYGHPWIQANLKKNRKRVMHTWAIFESTGWRKVKRSTTENGNK